jgi:ribonuclease BN (tRNA processing enzyme)
MQLSVLGSGTVAPTADRTAAAHWIEVGDVRLLLDCGAGTLQRAAQFGIQWHRVTHIAISHFHLDHWGELPHYLFALRWGIEPPRTEPLVLLGPTGLRARLTLAAGAFEDWLIAPEYGLEIVELPPGETHQLAAGVRLECTGTSHTPESLAFAVRSGGARLVYTGDTGFDAALAHWAGDCDVLLAECSLPDERAIDMHLTPTTAGRLATLARARRLVLTHFYPVFGTDDPATLARTTFDGPVTAARDGDRFTIPTV